MSGFFGDNFEPRYRAASPSFTLLLNTAAGAGELDAEVRIKHSVVGQLFNCPAV